MLLTVFFDIQGPLFVEFLEHRGTISSDVYYETLQSLRRSIKKKRQELLTKNVDLIHDNARPPVSSVTHGKRTKFKQEQLDHLPNSPHIPPYDIHVFGLLKKTPEWAVLQLRR